MPEYLDLDYVKALQPAGIDIINSHCGNGWRKLFNVYAKLLFSLNPSLFSFQTQAASWQQLRDQQLLQQNSATSLLFSPPVLEPATDTIHIIAGRTYAKALVAQGLNSQLNWLNHEFAIDKNQRLLVCPYFDYRQLTNEKISYLAALIAEIKSY